MLNNNYNWEIFDKMVIIAEEDSEYDKHGMDYFKYMAELSLKEDSE